MKIAIYSIALNESQFCARFCQAAKDADLIFVADTGSTDDTIAILKSNGATVVNISVKPWRFDDARNAALAMLPEDIDVCVSLDLDEVLQPGWRAEIERVWTPETTRLRYGFDWGCGIIFKYEKIHARHGYRWFCPVHEHPVPDRITEVWADTDMLLVIHKSDPNKSRGQYLDLLRMSVEENPTEPRNAFYYARELSFHSRWQESIDQAQRYLALPRANWANERCYAMRTMSRCYQELGDWNASLKWLRQACSESPDTREPWYELAVACYRMSRWAESYGAAMSCLAIEHRQWLYTADPAVWGALPHDYASIAAWNLGLYDEALKHARAAVEIDPDDVRLRNNLKFCEDKITNPSAAIQQPRRIQFLFVCNANMNRSAAGEHVARSMGYSADSAGSRPDLIFGRCLTLQSIEQADTIVCMEECHQEAVVQLAPHRASDITVWNIPDVYNYSNPELRVLLREKLEGLVASREKAA